MTTPTREELELYVMGAYDGDQAALEDSIASDPTAAAFIAEEARFELLLRDAGSAATFCPGFDSGPRITSQPRRVKRAARSSMISARK